MVVRASGEGVVVLYEHEHYQTRRFIWAVNFIMIKGVRAPEGHRDPVRGIRGEKIELARPEASADSESPQKSIRENFISFLIS
jgi:hypothetical protein